MTSRPFLRWVLRVQFPLAALGSAFSAQVDLPAKSTGAFSGSSAADLPALIQEFAADRSEVGRFYDLPWSSQRAERMEELYRQWQARLTTIGFDGLDSSSRIDYLLLQNKLQVEQARLALERRRLTEMERLLPFRKPIQDLQHARWRMEPLEPRTAAGALSPLPEAIKKLRKSIAKTAKDAKGSEKEQDKAKDKETKSDGTEPKFEVAASLARRAASAVDELRRTLKDWASFYDGFVPDFGWWVKKPNSETQTALEGYAKFLREEIAGLKGEDDDPLVGDPIGPEALAADLAAERLAYSPEELIAIGEKEFAWCESRMKEAAQQMGLGEDWKAALNKVKNNFVPPGNQAALIAEKARQAINFVKQHDLVTLPPLAEEIWRLSMLSPDAQRNLPYAAYSGPNMLVAYAREDMKHEDKMMSMRGNNPHFMHIVTPHELIPGHHLQHFMSQRHRSYRQLFGTPFYVEGWALYWEFNLWDRNYGATPEDRVGMLFWRMHRCARIIVSLKYHLGRMSPGEMVDFIVDRVGHERLGAASEVRRFIGDGYSPLYQCGYMIGGLQLRALRREAMEQGRFTEKQFNDAVLTQGPIPIEFIRASLLGTKLNRDAKPSWRFADY